MAENQKVPRANISLTGDNVKLLRKLQAKLQVKHGPMNVSLADTVVIALDKLDAELATEFNNI